jgi:hypothetical protein
MRAVKPKVDKLGRAITFGIRAWFIGCSIVPTKSSSFLKGVDCHVSLQRMRDW